MRGASSRMPAAGAGIAAGVPCPFKRLREAAQLARRGPVVGVTARERCFDVHADQCELRVDEREAACAAILETSATASSTGTIDTVR